MSSPSPDDPSTPSTPSTPPEELRDDELSKRFYYGGMCGLPWLWIVHALFYHGKQRSVEAQRMLRQEQNIAGKVYTHGYKYYAPKWHTTVHLSESHIRFSHDTLPIFSSRSKFNANRI